MGVSACVSHDVHALVCVLVWVGVRVSMCVCVCVYVHVCFSDVFVGASVIEGR